MRSSDSQIMARVEIENRARQRSWDVAATTTVPQLPPQALIRFDPMKIVPVLSDTSDQGKWQKTFNELFGRG